MSIRITSLAVVVSATLAACALEPAPQPDDYRAEALPGVQVPDAWTAGEVAGSATDGWLATFDDPQLQALVAEAMLHNSDLRIAAARVQVASEYLNLADSTLWPQVNLLARGGGKMGGDSSGMNGVGLFATWELDLWGRVRAGRAIAEETYASVAADAEYARQSVAALVAKSYFLSVEATLQQRLAEDMVIAAQQQVRLAEDRERIGNGTGYDVALARANLESFRDSVEKFRLAREQALRALESLVGRYPSAQVEVAAQLARAQGSVPAGLPSELLERRPDVIAASRRVAAAFHGVQEAEAARLPRISLTASVNSVSSDLFVLQDNSNPVWSIGANLLQPVFNAGALQTQVRIRTAEQQQAVAEYGRVGARAFAEVEDALSAEFASGRREEILARAVSANEQALELSQVRYRVGSGDLRAVAQQQIGLHASRTALIRVQTERLVQRVNLYLALGGGFGATPAPVAQAKE